MLRRFLVAPRQTGAVAPSSQVLARRMADLAFRMEPRTVVEIGAGSGAITRELAARARASGARFLAVELDGGLARKHRHGAIARADAAWLPVKHADVVVSGIPFASLPRATADQILREASRAAPRMVLFQYTTRKLPLIARHFPVLSAAEKVRWNLPPAYAIEVLVR